MIKEKEVSTSFLENDTLLMFKRLNDSYGKTASTSQDWKQIQVKCCTTKLPLQNQMKLQHSVRFHPELNTYIEIYHLTLYVPMGTLSTNRLNTKSSMFCPCSAFMCIVWMLKKTAVFSLNIN